MDLIIDFSSWRCAPDASAQPRIQLMDWRVLMDYEGECFLIGILPSRATLRITTAIQAVNCVSRTWRTQLGRVYETTGPPTENQQLCAQMGLLAQASGIGEGSRDETDVVWGAMQCAVQ